MQHGPDSGPVDAARVLQDLAAEEAAFERTFQEVMQKPELIVQPDPDLIDISQS